MASPIQVAQVMNRMQRVMRSPSHQFHVRMEPFCLCPVALAPVLPGETLKSAVFQIRAVSKPVKNALVGWWFESYWYYVKHRDLDERDQFSQMMLNVNWNPAPVQTAGASTAWYRGANSISWMEKCMKRITEVDFRQPGEAWNTWLSGSFAPGYPRVAINQKTWADSMLPTASVEGTTLDPVIVVGADDSIRAGEIDQALAQWEFLRANNMTNMDYEDYLATYGIRPSKEDLHIPELLRYTRKWTYPANTVEATTGVPSSALSWAIAERIDKDYFFREPGFIVGLVCARPKVYMDRQLGSAAGYLNNAMHWLPAVMLDNPETSYVRQPDNTLVDVTDTNGFYWDTRDLFLYGDQWRNVSGASDQTHSGVALPSLAAAKRYVSDTDIANLFVGATPVSEIALDGVIELNIASHTRDVTRTS